MKTISKIALAAVALLMTNIVVAQGKSGTHPKNHKVTTSTSGKTVREGARVNGSIQANANASQTAKDHANDNSVLNGGTGSTRVKTKTRKPREMDKDKDHQEVVKVKSNNRKNKVKKAKKTR